MTCDTAMYEVESYITQPTLYHLVHYPGMSTVDSHFDFNLMVLAFDHFD